MRIQPATAALLALALALSGCSGRVAGSAEAQNAPATSGAAQAPAGGEEPGATGAPGDNEAPSAQAAQSPAEAGAAPQQPEGDYISGLVQETVAGISHPGMSEFEMAKAAFDYMLENTSLLDPVGLELWRVRGGYSEPPSFVENRSLSVLLFRLGKCEDYAAALTMLLRGMGLAAEYVPGLTYSAQGALVDHAWTVVRVDGTWYHLDCQLEQNISRHGSVRYKYFMLGDATMAGSHRWGQNLIDSRLLRAEQNEEIAAGYIPPACPEDYPTPARRPFTLPEPPDTAAIRAQVEAELAAYEEEHGPLPPLEINVIPPVFALEGYGPQD